MEGVLLKGARGVRAITLFLLVIEPSIWHVRNLAGSYQEWYTELADRPVVWEPAYVSTTKGNNLGVVILIMLVTNICRSRLARERVELKALGTPLPRIFGCGIHTADMSGWFLCFMTEFSINGWI